MLGPIKNGLSTLNLPHISNLNSEEDLENALKNVDNSQNDEVDMMEKDVMSENLTQEDIIPENEENQLCPTCASMFEITNAVTCYICTSDVHISCGEPVYEEHFICSLCARREQLKSAQDDCHRRQKITAEKMVSVSTAKFPPLEIGDSITLSVPSVDKGPLDFRNILGIIVDKKNDLYQVGTEAGILKGWFPRPEIQKSGVTTMSSADIPQGIFITLREAATSQSQSGGQGFKKCNCKGQCMTNRCSCFKAQLKCGSRCHNSSTCANK